MKLYMAEGAFGGFKWISDYYALQDPDWTKIAASGLIDDAASQKMAIPMPAASIIVKSLLILLIQTSSQLAREKFLSVWKRN